MINPFFKKQRANCLHCFRLLCIITGQICMKADSRVGVSCVWRSRSPCQGQSGGVHHMTASVLLYVKHGSVRVACHPTLPQLFPRDASEAMRYSPHAANKFMLRGIDHGMFRWLLSWLISVWHQFWFCSVYHRKNLDFYIPFLKKTENI